MDGSPEPDSTENIERFAHDRITIGTKDSLNVESNW